MQNQSQVGLLSNVIHVREDDRMLLNCVMHYTYMFSTIYSGFMYNFTPLYADPKDYTSSLFTSYIMPSIFLNWIKRLNENFLKAAMV